MVSVVQKDVHIAVYGIVTSCLFSSPLVPESHVYLRYSTNRTEVIALELGFGASQNQDQLVLAYYSTQVRQIHMPLNDIPVADLENV